MNGNPPGSAPHWSVTSIVALRPGAARAAPQAAPTPIRPAPVPLPPIPDCYLLALLYLADAMALADGTVAPEEREMVGALADMARLPGFREHPWFGSLTEEGACAVLETDLVQQATLVAMSLVLKADGVRRPEEHALFTRIRRKLGAAPIRVPINLEKHKYAALNYIRSIIEVS